MKKAIVAFGLSSRDEDIHVVGDGLINDTWKVSGADGNAFILQRINHNVFKHPAQIDENIRLLKEFLTKYSPDYLSCPLPSTSGSTLLEIDGDFFRLFEFVRDSHCFTVLNEPSLAYEAAKEFGLFTSLLADFDASQLACTIPDFHNLTLRYDSYRASLFTASSERLELARSCIDIIEKHADIVDVYKSILVNDQIPQRVCHHDTKISNVLFNSSRKGKWRHQCCTKSLVSFTQCPIFYNCFQFVGLCVIDLDTVMPGYFFSDIGECDIIHCRNCSCITFEHQLFLIAAC